MENGRGAGGGEGSYQAVPREAHACPGLSDLNGVILPLTPSASPIDGQFDVAVVPRVPKATLFLGLLRLLLRLPGRWRRLTVYRGRLVVVTTPRRREELTVRRRALPLLVPAGIVETLRARSVDS
jgi:hypothetical protein